MLLNIVCLCAAAVCVLGAPSTDVVPLRRELPTVIPIVEQSEEIEANGTFKYSYETGNGIKREEISYDKVLPSTRSGISSNDTEEDNEVHVQQGSYSYTAPDGTLITVRYIADENGFRAFGDHLPKPPSILVASSRVSGRRSKTADSDTGSSAPSSIFAAVPVVVNDYPQASAPIVDNDPILESRIADTSAVQASVPISTGSIEVEPSTTPESTSTTEIPSTTEALVSTTESAIPTSTEPASTTTEPALTTTEPALTTFESASTTTESVSTTTESVTTSEVASTEPPTTVKVALITEASVPSITEAPVTAPAAPITNTNTSNATITNESPESTPNSDAAAEAATTASA